MEKDQAMVEMPKEFHKWADDYLCRQYSFYKPETVGQITCAQKRQLFEAWKAGRADLAPQSVNSQMLEALKKTQNSTIRAGNYTFGEGNKYRQGWNDCIDHIIAAIASAEAQGEKSISDLSIEDLQALTEFTNTYPTWWWNIGVCSKSRDFDCAPQGHSPEIKFIENGQWPDDAFSCDHEGSVADAIRQVMQEIAAAITDAGE